MNIEFILVLVILRRVTVCDMKSLGSTEMLHY